MPAYYNENDRFAAAALRALIAEGHIAPGDVDERSIADVSPDDLNGYQQVHLFAGCGGWSVALRLAGVPDDARLWSGSCPCQAFSLTGRRRGLADERHLWPHMLDLISKCRPPIVVGEQVEAAIGHGWLDVVFDDLEACDYACGAIVLPACSVGARQIRQRLWWIADLAGAGLANCEGCSQVREFDRQRPIVGDRGSTRWRDRWATEPGVGRVVHGVRPGNRAVHIFGNAIVPQVAAEFIQAYIETLNTSPAAS